MPRQTRLTERPGSTSVAASRRLGLPRRDFLHLGAAGLAASVATQAHSLASGAEQGADQPEPATPVRPAGPDPLYLQGRPDPTLVEAETWQEPWTWRPSDWPDARLDLNVVGHQNPGASPSRGNAAPALFSFGGMSPGPTIRTRGNETLRIRIRNLLGLNRGMKPIGPYPDPIDVLPPTVDKICRIVAGMDPESNEEPPICNTFFAFEEVREVIPGTWVPGYSMNDHTNGPHQAHVTNLHTHGLHVAPERNADGSHSDDVMLRIIPREDWKARQLLPNVSQRVLGDHEVVGEAEFTIRLGDVWRSANGAGHPHPPGTHWYHPHPHGAANDQVASGMAGFLIVEGDVDDAINRVMTGSPSIDTEHATGPYDYRERLMLIQRVVLQSIDIDAGPRRPRKRIPPVVAVNGVRPASVMFMRPGAVERWRVLNGSVDGKGTKRFMVLDGEFVETPGQLWRVVRPQTASGEDSTPGRGGGGGLGPGTGAGGGGGGGSRESAGGQLRYEPVSVHEIEQAKQPLHLLSMDGITLVANEGGNARHTIRDLSQVNTGTEHPLAQPIAARDLPFVGPLKNLEACFRDGDSVRRAFNRPNEAYLGNANRADIFFKAPVDSGGKVFTILAVEDWLNQDNTQQGLQTGISRMAAGLDPNDPSLIPLFRLIAPLDVVVGYIHVRGDAVEGGDFDVQTLRAVLPPVPPYLRPVTDEELRIPADEARITGAPIPSFRTRVLAYSGWGAAELPTVPVPESFAREHPELKGLIWDEWDGIAVLLPPDLRTMAIHGQFDLARSPDPGPPHKFSREDPTKPILLSETAEEWVLYNTSMSLWGHTDRERVPQKGSYGLHYTGYPISRAEGQKRFWQDHDFQITAKGNDHPFHIHVNPCWVTRIEVPDEHGTLHNVLEEPRWMDSVQIPRAGGRVVFRSRFPDFAGRWVHHCHILGHEDNGMMQVVESTTDPSRVNYSPRGQVASHGATAADIDTIYPRPSVELCFRHNMRFVDLTPTGYAYPGFDFEVPNLKDSG